MAQAVGHRGPQLQTCSGFRVSFDDPLLVPRWLLVSHIACFIQELFKCLEMQRNMPDCIVIIPGSTTRGRCRGIRAVSPNSAAFFSAATILEAKLQIARCVGSCRFVLCAFKNAASQGLELVCWGFPLWKAVCWCMRYIYNIMSPEFVGSVGCHVILKCFHSGTFCYFHSFSFHGWYVLRAALHCCLSVLLINLTVTGR